MHEANTTPLPDVTETSRAMTSAIKNVIGAAQTFANFAQMLAAWQPPEPEASSKADPSQDSKDRGYTVGGENW